MDNDPQTTSGPQEQPDQERQNRRQFFSGLGKWSLAIIAAVSSLAGYGDRAQAGREDAQKPEPQRPAWAAPGDRNQKMAGHFRSRHSNVHNNSNEHLNYGHGNSHSNSGIQ